MSGTFDYETQPQIAARQAANVEWLTAPYKRIIHQYNAVTCDNRRLFLSFFSYGEVKHMRILHSSRSSRAANAAPSK